MIVSNGDGSVGTKFISLAAPSLGGDTCCLISVSCLAITEFVQTAFIRMVLIIDISLIINVLIGV